MNDRPLTLHYRAHPPDAALRRILERCTVRPKVPKAPVTVSELEDLRGVVWLLYQRLETDPPDHVIIIASGAVPFGFALMRIVDRLGLKAQPMFHLFPGPRWRRDADGNRFEWQQYFIDELRDIIGDNARVLIIDTTSTGSTSFEQFVEVVGRSNVRGAIAGASIDYALLADRGGAQKKTSRIEVACAHGAPYRISLPPSPSLDVPPDVYDRSWFTMSAPGAPMPLVRAAFFGVESLFSEDHAALIGLDEITYMSGGSRPDRPRRLYLIRADGTVTSFESATALDSPFVNILAAPSEDTVWRALVNDPNLEGTLISEGLFLELPGGAAPLRLIDLQELPTGAYMASVDPSSKNAVEDLRCLLPVHLHGDVETLRIYGVNDTGQVFLEMSRAWFRIARCEDGDRYTVEFGPPRSG